MKDDYRSKYIQSSGNILLDCPKGELLLPGNQKFELNEKIRALLDKSAINRASGKQNPKSGNREKEPAPPQAKSRYQELMMKFRKGKSDD
jgi:hypothetical protein